tara:strand:+ start:1006 stop:1146 length:141 start_codon:yes stop_codon:yes gene_type:complete
MAFGMFGIFGIFGMFGIFGIFGMSWTWSFQKTEPLAMSDELAVLHI